MKIYKLIKYDLGQGFKQTKYKMIGIAVIVLVSCLDFYIRKNSSMEIVGGDVPKGSFMDYIFFLLGGMKVYHPDLETMFIFPIKWILLHLYLLYGVLYFPYRDLLSSMGGIILIKSNSRKMWWYSKCIWNISFMLAAYCIILVCTALFCLAAGETISFSISPLLITELMDTGSDIAISSPFIPFYTVLLPFIISICMGLLQMFVALFLKPVFSFGIMSIILLASAYVSSPYLIGNFAMPVRSCYIIEQGYKPETGIIAGILLIIFVIIVGAKAFKRYNILSMAEL